MVHGVTLRAIRTVVKGSFEFWRYQLWRCRSPLELMTLHDTRYKKKNVFFLPNDTISPEQETHIYSRTRGSCSWQDRMQMWVSSSSAQSPFVCLYGKSVVNKTAHNHVCGLSRGGRLCGRHLQNLVTHIDTIQTVLIIRDLNLLKVVQICFIF